MSNGYLKCGTANVTSWKIHDGASSLGRGILCLFESHQVEFVAISIQTCIVFAKQDALFQDLQTHQFRHRVKIEVGCWACFGPPRLDSSCIRL